MLLRPFLAAFRRPKLGKMSGKSPSKVIFRPRTKAVLGVSQWYLLVFYGVLGCSRMVSIVLGLKICWCGHFWPLFEGRNLTK
jgi:hypothetical protein